MNVKLAVFDMDGVLVKSSSSWEKLHKHFGVCARENFIKYLNGEITYQEFMLLDTLLWFQTREKIHRKEIEQVLLNEEIIEGAYETIKYIREHNIQTMILTSGIDILAHYVSEKLGIDYVLANSLVFDSKGYLIPGGIANVPLLDKDKVLRAWALRKNIDLHEIIYVGDSVYDIFVFLSGVRSIAFTCNPDIAKWANTYFCTKRLDVVGEYIVKLAFNDT